MNLERIASLLSQNLKPSQVASIVGCSPARITQISQQADFQLLLADKTATAEKESTESTLLDAKYLHAEHSLLNSVVEMAPSADLRDVTAALRVITERQFRKQQITNPIHNGSVTLTQNNITLSLPAHAVPEISLNSLNEVIAIDQQTLAPLSSAGVTDLFKNMKGNQNVTERIHPSAGQDVTSSTQEQNQLDFFPASGPNERSEVRPLPCAAHQSKDPAIEAYTATQIEAYKPQPAWQLELALEDTFPATRELVYEDTF